MCFQRARRPKQVGTRKISAMISLPVNSKKATKVSPQRQGITIAKHAAACPTFSQKATMRSHSPVPW